MAAITDFFPVPTAPNDVYATAQGGAEASRAIVESAARLGYESAQQRPPQHYTVTFVDFPFTDDSSEFADHLEAVRREQPVVAVAPDVEGDRDPDSVFHQADELRNHADAVVVVPKSIHPTEVPDRFRVGVPIADFGSGAEWQLQDYADVDDVHLLGASPTVQLEVGKYLPNVASIDGASVFKASQRGRKIWSPSLNRNWHEAHPDEFDYYERVEASLDNIVEAWSALYEDRPADYEIPTDPEDYATAQERADVEAIEMERDYRRAGTRGARPNIRSEDADLWDTHEANSPPVIDFEGQIEEAEQEALDAIQGQADQAGLDEWTQEVAADVGQEDFSKSMAEDTDDTYDPAEEWSDDRAQQDTLGTEDPTEHRESRIDQGGSDEFVDDTNDVYDPTEEVGEQGSLVPEEAGEDQVDLLGNDATEDPEYLESQDADAVDGFKLTKISDLDGVGERTEEKIEPAGPTLKAIADTFSSGGVDPHPEITEEHRETIRDVLTDPQMETLESSLREWVETARQDYDLDHLDETVTVQGVGGEGDGESADVPEAVNGWEITDDKPFRGFIRWSNTGAGQDGQHMVTISKNSSSSYYVAWYDEREEGHAQIDTTRDVEAAVEAAVDFMEGMEPSEAHRDDPTGGSDPYDPVDEWGPTMDKPISDVYQDLVHPRRRALRDEDDFHIAPSGRHRVDEEDDTDDLAIAAANTSEDGTRAFGSNQEADPGVIEALESQSDPGNTDMSTPYDPTDDAQSDTTTAEGGGDDAADGEAPEVAETEESNTTDSDGSQDGPAPTPDELGPWSINDVDQVEGGYRYHYVATNAPVDAKILPDGDQHKVVIDDNTVATGLSLSDAVDELRDVESPGDQIPKESLEFGGLEAANEFRDEYEEHLHPSDHRSYKTVEVDATAPEDVLDEAGKRVQISHQDETKNYGQMELSEDEQAKLKRMYDNWQWGTHGFQAQAVKAALKVEGVTDWMNYYEPGMDQEGALSLLDSGKEMAAKTGAPTATRGDRTDSDVDPGKIGKETDKAEGAACDQARDYAESGHEDAASFLVDQCDWSEDEVDQLLETAKELGEDPAEIYDPTTETDNGLSFEEWARQNEPTAPSDRPEKPEPLQEPSDEEISALAPTSTDELTGPALRALKKAWAGYKAARAESRTQFDEAEKYAEVINGVRSVNDQDPIDFDQLEWEGGEVLPDDPSETYPAPEGEPETLTEALRHGHASQAAQSMLTRFSDAAGGDTYDPREEFQ